MEFKLYCRKTWDGKYTILTVLIVSFVVILIIKFSSGKHDDPIKNIADNLHINGWDWIALIVALFSLVVSVMAWRSQDETRKNTAIVSKKELRDKLAGYYHSVIRNVVNLYSLYIAMELNDWDSYPSEEYMWKMKLTEFDEDKISVRLVYGDRFHKIQNLNELIRFFNLHVDASIVHLKNGNLDMDIRIRDVNNLKSMIWLIAKHLSDTMDQLFPYGKDGKNKIKIKDNLIGSVDLWYGGIDQSHLPSMKYESFLRDIESKQFIDYIFKSDEKHDFLHKLKSVIIYHLSKTKDGYDRIPLIKL